MVSDVGRMGISQVLCLRSCWCDGNGHIQLLVVTLIDCSVTTTHEALKFLEQCIAMVRVTDQIIKTLINPT